METPAVNAKRAPWHTELNRDHWRLFWGSLLGRLFDGYETYILFLVVSPALRQLLEPTELPNLIRYAGIVVATTLLGRATGGVLAGVAADYFGRRRAMVTTILLYALFTGLTGLTQSWAQLATLRFLTGLSLGGDLAIVATLISESWPAQARAKGQSLMQSAFAWGSLVAAGVWFLLEPVGGASAWRVPFFVGLTPAFFALYIRRSVPESTTWLAKQAERKELQTRRQAGSHLSRDEKVVSDFTVVALFRNPTLRRRVLLCMVMSLGTTVGYWAISGWIPAYTESLARTTGQANPARWAATAGLLYNGGAILGYVVAAFLADVLGRRPLLAFYFAGSLLTTPLLYLGVHSPQAAAAAAALNGMFTLGQFAWIAIYPPELFPTAVRATAASVIFNTGRFLSFFAPWLAGILISRLGGCSTTAVLFSLIYLPALCAVPFLPETRGKPLPT